VTTFGPATEAERAVARVKAVHRHITGVAADGRGYDASDPHLLRWVHVAEVDSFLAAYQRYGVGERLDQDERDAYVAETALVAAKLGISDPPRSQAELRDELLGFRAELTGTPQARDAARFLLLRPPLPAPARVPYAALAASAVALMPAWTRRPLRLPYLPLTEATVGRLGGRTITAALHWAMSASEPPSAA
ncbi:MAG TPA: oxygenase MpaB family protein, partial [Jatrophihabitans sp.]|nr:oxygenase MpaB family protein [Jatrophihabitans sp.]